MNLEPVRSLAAAELARRRLLDFCILLDPSFIRAKHIELLADYLERVDRREIRRLIIAMPPRHGKTQLVSRNFVAWTLGRNPKSNMVLASYGADLAEQNSRRVRELVTHERYPFPKMKLREDSRAVNRWETTKGGFVMAAGVGSALTGFGADLMIIDDPVRDREAAESAAIRESTWTWYTDVARTRLHPGGAQVVISTRWHEDDLVGRILDSAGASDWTTLVLPAIAEDNDPLGRAPGEALWPERYPASELSSVDRGEISSRSWSALYQQRPSPASGNVFKYEWFQNRYERLERTFRRSLVQDPFTTVERSFTMGVACGVDCASKTGVSNDYTVFVTAFSDGVRYYIADVVRERLEFNDLIARAHDVFDKWKPRLLTIEDTSAGIPLIQVLRAHSPIPVVPVRAVGSKEARADAITPLFESGKVLLPERAPWLDAFIHEFCTFPAGRHDDQIDATHLALSALLRASSDRRQSLEVARMSQVWGN